MALSMVQVVLFSLALSGTNHAKRPGLDEQVAMLDLTDGQTNHFEMESDQHQKHEIHHELHAANLEWKRRYSTLDQRYRSLESSYDTFLSAMSLPALYAKMHDQEMFAPEEWSHVGTPDAAALVQVGTELSVRPGDQVCIRGRSGRTDDRVEATVHAAHSDSTVSLVQVVYSGMTKVVDVGNAKNDQQIFAAPTSGNCQDA